MYSGPFRTLGKVPMVQAHGKLIIDLKCATVTSLLHPEWAQSIRCDDILYSSARSVLQNPPSYGAPLTHPLSFLKRKLLQEMVVHTCNPS